MIKDEKICSILEKIENLKNSQEINNYLDKQIIYLNSVKPKVNLFIEEYVATFYSDFSAKIIDKKLSNLSNKFTNYYIYKDKCALKQKSQNSLPDAEKYLQDFINQSSNLKKFCESQGLKESKFNFYLNIVEQQNNSLFKKYLKRVTIIELKETSDKIKEYLSKIKIISSLIKNGIETPHGIREFDILDYDDYIEESIQYVMLRIENKMSFEEEFYFRIFVKDILRDQKMTPDKIAELIRTSTYYNCENDEKGMPNPNTGTKISSAEKLVILNYMENNNIKMTFKRYNAFIKRYLNGFWNITIQEKETQKNSLK